jgi:hypothetical protein
MSIHEGAVSPFAVSLMLTCYWSPEPVTERAQDWSTEAGVEINAWLVAQGLIDPKTWRATERGKAWVEFICATPLPFAKWTLPERPKVSLSEWQQRILQEMGAQDAA